MNRLDHPVLCLNRTNSSEGRVALGEIRIGLAGVTTLFDGFQALLEHFQAKWKPVRRPKMRQIKQLERFRDSI